MMAGPAAERRARFKWQILAHPLHQVNDFNVLGSGTFALGDDFQKAGLHSADERVAGFGNYKRKTSLTLPHQSWMAQLFNQEIASCAAFVKLAAGWNTAKLPETMNVRQTVQKSR